MTDKHILESLRLTNARATQRDVDAVRRFMHCFDCEDCETYAEAKEKIEASMAMISEELELTEDPEEQRAILRQRHAKI